MSARKAFDNHREWCSQNGEQIPHWDEFDTFKAGLEAAAKVCDDAEEGARKADNGEPFHEGAIMACGFCSTGIRKLKDGE